MAVQSAIEGDGEALARSQMVKDDIARGNAELISVSLEWLKQQVVLDTEKYRSRSVDLTGMLCCCPQLNGNGQ